MYHRRLSFLLAIGAKVTRWAYARQQKVCRRALPAPSSAYASIDVRAGIGQRTKGYFAGRRRAQRSRIRTGYIAQCALAFPAYFAGAGASYYSHFQRQLA